MNANDIVVFIETQRQIVAASYATIAQLVIISGAHKNTIRRILNNPARRAAELPGSELVRLGKMSQWRIPAESALAYKPKKVGRQKKE